MNKKRLRDALTDLAHKHWTTWMLALLQNFPTEEDGSIVIPKSAVEHFKRLMIVIPNPEKNGFKDEADKAIMIFERFIQLQDSNPDGRDYGNPSLSMPVAGQAQPSKIVTNKSRLEDIFGL